MRIRNESIRNLLEVEIATRYNLRGFRLPEGTWKGLIEDKYVANFREKSITLEDMLDAVKQWHTRAGLTWSPNGSRQEPAPEVLPVHPDERGRRRSRNIPLRREAISVLLAHSAEQDEAVKTFRKSVLRNRLISLDGVEAWIKKQAVKDGPATIWIEFPLPAGTELSIHGQVDPPVTVKKFDGKRFLKRLKYGIPKHDTEMKISVARGGVLDRLRRISEHLAGSFGWQESQAMLFVLTGTMPVVSHARCSLRLILNLPVATRVRLTVDPILSPTQVANLYRQARQEVFQGERHRNLEEKHLHIAMFAADRPEGETLAASMKRWNKQFPKWKYESRQVTNFGRDLGRDPRRLLYPGSKGRSRRS